MFVKSHDVTTTTTTIFSEDIMNTSLIISETMNLNDLADRMGGATADEAHQMRFVLVCSGWDGKTIDEVSESEWLSMINEAVELAAL